MDLGLKGKVAMVAGASRGLGYAVAEALARQSPDFGYANLAIRGRKLPAIVDEQVGPALELAPDLTAVAARHGFGSARVLADEPIAHDPVWRYAGSLDDARVRVWELRRT